MQLTKDTDLTDPRIYNTTGLIFNLSLGNFDAKYI